MFIGFEPPGAKGINGHLSRQGPNGTMKNFIPPGAKRVQ